MKRFRITYLPNTWREEVSPLSHSTVNSAAIGWFLEEDQLRAIAELDKLEVGQTVLDEDGDRWERVE